MLKIIDRVCSASAYSAFSEAATPKTALAELPQNSDPGLNRPHVNRK